jgi:putative ABC transport system permease protein
MLGIVIGVGSVILLLAVGSGSQRAVEQSISKLGTNLLVITSGIRNSNGLKTTDISKFTFQDADIISGLPSVEEAFATTAIKTFQVSSNKNNISANVTGITEPGFRVRNWEFDYGDPFTDEDIKAGKRVVVLGATVTSTLFDDNNPIGENVRIGTTTFRVLGTLKPKGQTLDGRDQDNVVFMPITTAQAKLWGSNYWQGVVQNITAKAISDDAMLHATEEIRETLRERFKLRENNPDTFNIRNMTAISQVASDTARAMSILLGSIASISLIVGGIGIMNIMLVTVSERTREIGIRKAIGASEKMILIQFLMEALMISGVGSLLGLIVGFGLGFIAENTFRVPTHYSIWSVVISLIVAGSVGIISGFYPAFKAAKLEPIEALRVS